MRPFVRDRLKQDVPYLNESSPISFCLIEKRGQGAFLCAAMEILVEIQNDFLQKMLSIASTGKCSALVFLEKEEGKFSIPVVHLQEAREKEIIQYQWTDEILRHSQRNTEYGHGREIFFDLEKIEKEMAVRFLVGKSYLSTREGLQEFHFAGELFHTCGGILDDLQELIPQQPLTDVFRNSLSRQYEQSLKNVQDLLEHMEIVLCLLKRHRVGKPKDPLTEFTDKWVRGPRPFPKDLLPQPHSAIQLTHVVALYEFLEDMLAESAAKRVHDRYRVPIPEEITNEMTKGTPASGATESHRSVLNAITAALKRFIYRYLSSEEMKPELAESLKERMRERSLWPIDAFKVWNPEVESPSIFIGDVFPEKLAIKHTYQVLCFYQDRLKMLEEEKHVSRNPAPKISGPSASRPRQHKNRRHFSIV
ncbi:E3 ubiquitin-protein ligase RNF213-like [Porites lutea]|uniref:E3 ubiquitin-protein ligase RNF213-like n=1 Tax=Porites lutea TaxID=51062 RepID=UPI003CC5669C